MTSSLDDISKCVMDLWAQAENVSDEELCNCIPSDDKQHHFARHVSKVWAIDGEIRRSRSLPSANWNHRHTKFKNYAFEVLFARLNDVTERLKIDWQQSNVSDEALLRYIPTNEDVHHPLRDWFAERIIIVDKPLYLESGLADAGGSEWTSTRYRQLQASLSQDFDIGVPLKHIWPWQIDFQHVQGSLDLQTQQPVNGAWRLGDYIIKRKIGEGGNSVVYLAFDNRLNCDIALKVPRFKLATLHQGSLRPVIDLLNEARRNRAVSDSPGLVKIYYVHCPSIAAGMSDDEVACRFRYHLLSEPVAIAMEYVDGPSLRRTLQDHKGKITDLPMLAALMCDISRPLIHLHQSHLVHRDLKPENIIIRDSDKQPVLCDLGLATWWQEIGKDESFLRGTLPYLAPEQTIKGQQVTPASDIWALGVIMFEASTGELPFAYKGTGDSREEISRRIREVPPPSPRSLTPTIEPEFQRICLTCLEKDPSKRYASVLDFQEAITHWLSLQQSSARHDANRRLGYFAWNPEIYSASQEQGPGYLLIKVARYRSDTFVKVEELLRKHGCTTYRIYESFGDTDIVVRGYFGQKQFTEICADEEERRHFGIGEIRKSWVKKIRHHWYWGKGTFERPDAHTLLLLLPLAGVPSWTYVPAMQSALAKKVIREVQPTQDQIIFFVFIRRRMEEGMQFDRNQIFESVVEVMDQYETRLRNFAIYEFHDNAPFGLVKAECDTGAFFQIGRFVSDLNKQMSAMSCVTMTCVVSDLNILGKEVLDKQALAFSTGGHVVAKHFPRLHEYLKSKGDASITEQIESWVSKYFSLDHNVMYTASVFGMIEKCLLAIARKEDANFKAVIGAIVSRAIEAGDIYFNETLNLQPIVAPGNVEPRSTVDILSEIVSWVQSQGIGVNQQFNFADVHVLRRYTLVENFEIRRRNLWFDALTRLMGFHEMVWMLGQVLRGITGESPFEDGEYWK